MNKFMHILTRPFARFAKDTTASIAVEAVLIIPLLAAWFVGSFVFFDAFKSRNTALKASFTVSDIISRRTEDASVTYLNNLHRLYEELAGTRNSSAMRITMVNWDGDKHSVVWSYSSKQSLRLKSNRAAQDINFVERVPMMAVGENVILVETLQDYNPVFNVGINHNVWENFVVTSPRYASKLGYDSEGRATVGKDEDFIEEGLRKKRSKDPVRNWGQSKDKDKGQGKENNRGNSDDKGSKLKAFLKKAVAYVASKFT